MKYILLILLAVLAGCDQPSRVESLPEAASPSPYLLCKAPTLPKELQLQAYLDTTEAGQLELKLLIRNKAEKPLSVNPNEAALLTHDQRRQQYSRGESELQSIAPGEERLFSWQFQPVNDLYLYQHSGLHGPLQQQYRLPLSFIAGLKDTAAFCYPEEAYMHYSKKQEQAKPVLYRTSPEALTPQAAARQETYLRGIIEHTADAPGGSAHFSDQEFFSGGVNLRYSVYQLGDSLYLKLNLVNHAPQVLALKPAQMLLSVQGEPQQPVRITTGAASSAHDHLIRKGDRMPVTLVYSLPSKADSLLVRLDGIQLQEFKQPLFKEAVYFIRQ